MAFTLFAQGFLLLRPSELGTVSVGSAVFAKISLI